MTISIDDRLAIESALGAALIAQGKLDQRSLDRALRVRSNSRDSLLRLITNLGFVSERDMAEAISAQLNLPLLGPRDYPTQPVLEGLIGCRFLKDARVLPLALEGNDLILAMADPLDQYALDAVRMRAGCTVHPRVAIPAELEAAFERLYENDRSSVPADDIAGASADDATDLDVERLRDLASEAPVIRLVNNMISRAMESRASDIHLEPFEDRLRVRFRIDGVLREVDQPPNQLRAAIVSRIKIMARLNIAERRLPQDGRIKVAVRGTQIDLRVATAPTLHGESVVLRLLDREGVKLDFGVLGLSGRNLNAFADALDRPHGIVLVTGPTGSGKTTTLYASLVRLNTLERKILTVEDPIEYQLDGINQIQVKQGIGLGFADVLRSLLRHDPDIIMVGEIRDVETAEIAVQAALTGHLVLSTLHTNSAAASITRLLDMGVQDYLLTSTLTAVAAQRLVRTLCKHCRQPYIAIPELAHQLGLHRFAKDGAITLFKPQGCEECAGTGFRGRTCIFETLVISNGIRRQILRHVEAGELHRNAVEEGMQTMYENGMLKALSGQTTVEEVLKVTREA